MNLAVKFNLLKDTQPHYTKILTVRTNGALRCRRDYPKRQKNVRKNLLDLFADLKVFESGTLQVNYFEIHV
jgi:protein-tyrosine phosphatase